VRHWCQSDEGQADGAGAGFTPAPGKDNCGNIYGFPLRCRKNAPVFSAVVACVFFGLQAVTNEPELPFRNVQNGLPLDAMCRMSEISVWEALDRTPPAELCPTNHVLS